MTLSNLTELATFRHTFSHYHLQVQPIKITGSFKLIKEQQSQWCNAQVARDNLGLPKPMLQVLAALS
jgi:A/G-specific adenine glycosylase